MKVLNTKSAVGKIKKGVSVGVKICKELMEHGIEVVEIVKDNSSVLQRWLHQ